MRNTLIKPYLRTLWVVEVHRGDGCYIVTRRKADNEFPLWPMAAFTCADEAMAYAEDVSSASQGQPIPKPTAAMPEVMQ